MRTRAVALALVALALAVLLFMFARNGGGRAPAKASGSLPGIGGSLLPGSPTALPQFDPAMFQRLLAQLHGRPAVVNFWASWCGPCTAEAPVLARAARDFQGKVQFVGVDIQDQLGPARQFVRTFGVPYPSVSDPQGSIRNAMGFIGQPDTVVFDATGARVWASSGAVKERALRAELAKLTA